MTDCLGAEETEIELISPFAYIHPDAVVGENNQIGDGVWIGPNVTIGDDNVFEPYSVIGTPGQYRDRECFGGVVIGNRNVFREGAQVHSAMDKNAVTQIGDDGYFMTNAHISHDCILGNGITMCSGATLGGDVMIQDYATLGFGAIVHQQQTIGAASMLGMGTIVPKGADIAPGEKYAGNPAQHLGRNTHALRKHNLRDLRHYEKAFWERRPKGKSEDKSNALRKLEEYMETRDRKFGPERYDILKAIIDDVPWQGTNVKGQLYNALFSLCWQQAEDQRADQLFIRELLIDAITGGTIPPGGEAKGKVGWLVNHIALGTYAPFKHVFAYLSGMEPCEIIVHGSVHKSEAAAIQRMGHSISQLQMKLSDQVDHVEKLCKEKGIGVLIADIYTAPVLFSFMRRVAPLQVYLSPGFQRFPADLVLVPETQAPLLMREQHASIPTVALREHLVQPVERKPRGKVFGCLSRAEKCSDEYVAMVRKVLDAVPGSIFVHYGRGALPTEDARIRSLGIANPHEALAQIDVYLDTYPRCSGLSAFEAMAHGVPVVTRDHHSVTDWNLFKPCVVQTAEEYVVAASQALGAKGLHIATEGREIVEARLTNVPRAVAGLYKALENAGWQR